MLPLLALALSLLACARHPAPEPVAAMPTGAEEWARPLTDYIEAGIAKLGERRFSQAIHDLEVHGGCLHLAYGDGGINIATAAQLDVELRALCDPEDPTDLRRFATGEESVYRLRVLGDGGLYVAGPDATDADELRDEPDIRGSLYVLGEAGWQKLRTVPGAEHVEDITLHDGALYMAGSGADGRAEWDTVGAHRFIWRSDDGGRTVRTLHKQPHPGRDTRYRHLLPVGEDLLAFGFKGDEPANARVDGDEVTELADGPLAGLLAWQVLPAGPDLGLVYTTEGRAPARLQAVRPGGAVEPVPGFDGASIPDMWWDAEERAVWVLTQRRTAYGQQVTVHRLPADDLSAAEIVVRFEHPEPVTAVARWDEGLYIGDRRGILSRLPR